MIGNRYPPTEGRMVQCGPAFRAANPHVCPGPSFGKLSGGNWMACGPFGGFGPGESFGWASGFGSAPDRVNILYHPPSGVGCD